MTYLVVDANNLVNRATRVFRNPRTREEWVAGSLSIIFRALGRNFAKFGGTHCVACFDSGSWRDEYYPDYRSNRKVNDKTPEHRIASKKITREINDLFAEFLGDNTNVTVLAADAVEADDFAARWTRQHRDRRSVIMTTDSDLRQLVTDLVDVFDPTTMTVYTLDGVFQQLGVKAMPWPKVTRYGETWLHRVTPKGTLESFDPRWEVFRKCVRGDRNEMIRPAYPRVREGQIRAAYESPGSVEWNNLINHIWTDSAGENHAVRNLYDLNRLLIDLTAQPSVIIEAMDYAIETATEKPVLQAVELRFNEFCSTYNLTNLNRTEVIKCLSAPRNLP